MLIFWWADYGVKKEHHWLCCAVFVFTRFPTSLMHHGTFDLSIIWPYWCIYVLWSDESFLDRLTLFLTHTSLSHEIRVDPESVEPVFVRFKSCLRCVHETVACYVWGARLKRPLGWWGPKSALAVSAHQGCERFSRFESELAFKWVDSEQQTREWPASVTITVPFSSPGFLIFLIFNWIEYDKGCERSVDIALCWFLGVRSWWKQ